MKRRFSVVTLLFLISHLTCASSEYVNELPFVDMFNQQTGLPASGAFCAVPDKRGFLYLGTQNGVVRFDGKSFKQYLHRSDGKGLAGDWITGCLAVGDKLVFSASSGGLSVLDPDTDKIRIVAGDGVPVFAEDKVWGLGALKSGELWLTHQKGGVTLVSPDLAQSRTFSPKASEGKIIRSLLEWDGKLLLAGAGLYSLDPKTGEAATVPGTEQLNLLQVSRLKDGRIITLGTQGVFLVSAAGVVKIATLDSSGSNGFTQVLENQDGSLWFSGFGTGLWLTDQDFNPLKQYRKQVGEPGVLASDDLMGLVRLRDGTLWILSNDAMVMRMLPGRQQFTHIKAPFANPFVRAIIKARDGSLWYGHRGGISRQQGDNWQHYDGTNAPFSNTNIFSLFEDSQGMIWAGSYGGGAYAFDGQRWQVYSSASHGLASDHVFTINQDSLGRIWIGGNRGISLLNPGAATAERWNSENSGLKTNAVFSSLRDGEHMWLGTLDGVIQLDNVAKATSHIGVAEGLSHNMVMHLSRGPDGAIWAGTMQGLNLLEKQGGVRQFGRAQGLSDENAYCIGWQDANHLWLGTSNGLNRIALDSGKVEVYLHKDGLQHSVFTPGACASDGEQLVFGGANGISRFTPTEIEPRVAPSPLVSDIRILNRPIGDGSDFGIELPAAVAALDNLQLTHEHSLISLGLATPGSLEDNSRFRYRYRLEPYDRQWMETDADNPWISYTQLPAGHYRLQVEALSADGLGLGPKSIIGLEVQGPWWLSLWAKALYLGLALTLLWLMGWLWHSRKLATQASVHSAELAAHKTRLIDTLNHELRTPLTLIYGPAQSLGQEALPPKVQALAVGISHQSERLLRLLDELLFLDETGSSGVKQRLELGDELSRLCGAFDSLAQKKSLALSFTHLEGADSPLWVKLRSDALDKMVGNLIQNAIKYTDSGTVTVSLARIGDEAEIRVTDSGAGIPVLQQSQIFERFTQLDTKRGGVGLGLALVREQVIAEGGSIALESEPGIGSCFTLRLPLEPAQHSDNAEPNTSAGIETDVATDGKKLLLIEDNPELRDYYRTLLEGRYQCHFARDGAEGIALAASLAPDLIVTDLLMPGADGFAVLKTLRGQLETSHIPIIVISAQTDVHNRIKAFDELADDFIAKPFAPQELEVRIERLLAIRQLLSDSLKQGLRQGEPDTATPHTGLSEADRRFCERIEAIVAANFADEQFGVESFASEACLSSRALQLKIKALFGMSPGDYLRLYRLARAKALLSETGAVIGEIAQQCGFASQSYFGRCFKQEYASSPSEFRQRLQRMETEE